MDGRDDAPLAEKWGRVSGSGLCTGPFAIDWGGSVILMPIVLERVVVLLLSRAARFRCLR